MVIGETVARYEQPPLLELPQALKAFGAMPEAGLQIYENISGNPKFRAKQQADFLAGTIHNLVLDQNEMSLDELAYMAWDLYELSNNFSDNLDAWPEERAALLEKVHEKYAAARFLHQAKLVYELAEDDERRPVEATYLQEMTEFIYGRPEQGLFNTLLAGVRQQAGEQVASSDPFVAQTAGELLDPIAEPVGELTPLFKPSEALRTHYETIIKNHFKPLIEHLNLDHDRIYELKEMVEIFNQALQFVGARGWKSVMKKGATNRATSQTKKRVTVGTESEPMRGDQLELLVVHEVGVHVWTRILGEGLDDPNLHYMGLVGAEPIEEGTVKIAEEIFGVRNNYKMEGHYLHAGLSLGMDGTPRDFRQVFEIAWRRNIVTQAAAGKEITQEVVTKARKDAYIATTRVKRGMPTDIPGMTFTKDAMYLQGYQDVWHFLDEQLLDDIQFAQLFMGKHMITREDQRRIVAAAGPKNYNKSKKG